MSPAENPAILSVSISNGMTVKIRLGWKEIRIGRSKEAALLPPDPSVSRIHARIFRVGEQYFLSDTSRNGTFVDGKRISQVQLEGGLSFRIGPYRILFSREGRSHSSSEPPPVTPGSGSDLMENGSRRCSSRAGSPFGSALTGFYSPAKDGRTPRPNLRRSLPVPVPI